MSLQLVQEVARVCRQRSLLITELRLPQSRPLNSTSENQSSEPQLQQLAELILASKRMITRILRCRYRFEGLHDLMGWRRATRYTQHTIRPPNQTFQRPPDHYRKAKVDVLDLDLTDSNSSITQPHSQPQL
jgi:hypothetical protein